MRGSPRPARSQDAGKLGMACDEESYLAAARRHLAWVLGHVAPETGWIDLAGFDQRQHEARIAFTHTIAYTIWGILHGADSCGDEEGVCVAERAPWAVARRWELGKGLAGMLDWRWRAQADFACLTGSVQMALVSGSVCTSGAVPSPFRSCGAR